MGRKGDGWSSEEGIGRRGWGCEVTEHYLHLFEVQELVIDFMKIKELPITFLISKVNHIYKTHSTTHTH